MLDSDGWEETDFAPSEYTLRSEIGFNFQGRIHHFSGIGRQAPNDADDNVMKKWLTLVSLLLLGLFVVQRFRGNAEKEQNKDGSLRFVSLAPNLTEIIFGLGLGDRIVGVTLYCTYPPETAEIEKVGDFIHPNLEKIVHLAPSLVLAEYSASSKTVSRLRSLGVPVVEVKSPRSLAEVYQLIGRLGKTLQEPQAADRLIESMKQQVEMIKRRSREFPNRPSLYLEIDPPSWTVGRQSFLNEAIRVAGARNIFEDVDRPALQVSKEMIVARDPEIIVSFHSPASEIRARPGWRRIRAVRENRIIDDLDPGLLSQGSQRLAPGMEQLQNRLRAALTGERPR